MNKRRFTSFAYLTSLRWVMGMAVCVAGSATHAAAQDDAAPSSQTKSAQSADASTIQPGDIIVTALKRSETAQKVPATINVVSQQVLANTGSTSILQIANVAPGLNISKPGAGNEVSVTIRGVGSLAQVPSFDSSVSLFADGIYLPRSREFAASMFDVERIEVIRGTQAALLGKNTSLGAINLVSRKPGESWAVDYRASYELERGSTQFAGGIDIPITQKLAFRVSGLASNDQGWVYNQVTKDYEPHRKDVAARAVLRWDASDTFDVTAIAQTALSRNQGSGVEFNKTDGTPEFLAALAGYPGVINGHVDRVNAQSSSPSAFDRLATHRYSLIANLKLGDYTVTSSTGYSNYKENDYQDIDFVPGDYLARIVDESGHQFSQEVRIASPVDRPVDFIAGALYLKGRLNNKTDIDANYPFGPVPGFNLAGALRTDFVQNTEAVSLFGQANYKITDQFRVSLGGRYTHERKDADLARQILQPGLVSLVVFPPYAPLSLTHKENNFDYSVGLQYDLSADAMLFASYGKGTKSGGFAQSVTLLPDAGYKKEIAKTAEIGLKWQDPARRWLFNISAFNTNVDGFQQVTFNGFAFIIGNTDLRTRGFEMQAFWRPVDALRISLNNTYADAKDKITGNPAPLAPKWSGTGDITYRSALSGSLDFILNASIDYRTRRYYLPDPAAAPVGAAFTPINLSVAVARQDNGWELRLIGRNITNENALNSGNPAPFLPAGNEISTSERGRTIALQLSGKF